MEKESLSEEVKKNRLPTYPIHPLLLNRWSPRAMSGEEMSDDELMPLFEAARWAPSSYNEQPWRFIYAKRNTPEWEPLFSLLIEFNQSWARQAAALVVVISHNFFQKEHKPSITHSFDTGAAWENLAIEGTLRGYVVHGMQGFDYEKTKTSLAIPEDYTVEAMIAIGKKAPKDSLPEKLQAREIPSQRKPLNELLMKGKFQR